MRLTTWIAILTANLSLLLAQVPEESLFAETLQKAGLTPTTARFDPDLLRFFDRGEYLLPTFESWYSTPYRLPFYAAALRTQLLAAVTQSTAPSLDGVAPSALVEIGGRMLKEGTVRRLLGDPLVKVAEQAKQPTALQDAIRQIYRAAGVPLPLKARQKMGEDLKQVPLHLQQQAAFLLYTALATRRWRNAALGAIGDLNKVYRLLTQPAGTSEEQELEAFWALYSASQKVDLKKLFAGAHDLVLAAQRAALALKQADEKTQAAFKKAFAFEMDTPWGRVALYGGANDLHPRLPYLLLVDTGGKDTYYGGATTASVANAISVLIDLEGSDQYVPHAGAIDRAIAEDAERRNASGVGFGGGVLGYALLMDLEGDDLYRSPAPGLGTGLFGVGLLADFGGNDLYDGYTYTQGAGYFGIGILLDIRGEDRYLAFQSGQGFGGTKGFGLLLDKAGADHYIANDTQIDFPSPQTKEHNASLAQGMGYGRRADFLDGHSLAGGFGVLMDLAGDDRYSCGVFGQGAGYWSGTGILIDLQGNDQYKGIWYVQGSAAHFAIGYLEDRAGDDRYEALMNMAQGAGHDFSIGFLLEMAGADLYEAPSLALGGGNANGIGVFVEMQGDDQYRIRPNTAANLGRANSETGTLRERGLCLGLFIDLAGNDTYPPEVNFAGNQLSWLNWSRKNEKPQESQLGIGLDK